MKTIDDVKICPDCKSDNCYSYDIDEVEFSYDGIGHYYVNCRCRECKNIFRLYAKFKYEVIESYTRD